MSKVLVSDSNLTNIANSIRTKLGVHASYTPSQMSGAIDSIPSAGSVETEFAKVVEGGATNITLPNSITSIRERLFQSYTNLQSVLIPNSVASIGQYAFQNCTNLDLLSLPSGLTSIGDYAFMGCSTLSLAKIPSNVISIGAYAFCNCLGLTTITFEGTPTTVDGHAFAGCGNLTAINVPWAQGAVASVPWGAINATVHYNYTG